MSIEFQILDWIQTLRTPALDAVMCAVTHLGDVGIIWILLAVFLLAIPKTRRSGVVLVCAFAMDVVLCNIILKPAIGRIRPCEINTAVQLLVARPHDFSFPSGHTAASFATVGALYFAGEKKLWKPVLVLAVLIAFSRLYLYVHYPSDIIGGIVVGLMAGYAGKRIADWMEQKRMTRQLKTEG